MKANLLSAIIAGAVIAFVSGCASSKTPTPKRVYNLRDSPDQIAALHKPVVPPENLNHSLTELERGLLFFQNGDYLDADRRFANALKIMDRIKEKGEGAAVAIDEQAKVFKGEPYERATAYLLRGLSRFNLADYSGALAAFRSSLVSDAETRNKEVKKLEDFTISQFMAALCYARLGEMDNADAMLALARTNAPGNPILKSEYLRCNFLAVIGVGCGPFKIGPRKYLTGLSPEKKVELIVGENPAAAAVEATDLLSQAKSQGRGAADNARVARKVGKAILSGVLSGLSGVQVNIPDNDDVRSWQGLPLKFYVFAGDVPAGVHTLTLHAWDDKAPMERYTQTWHEVPVSADPGPILYLRDVRNMQNHYSVEHEKSTQAPETPTAAAK